MVACYIHVSCKPEPKALNESSKNSMLCCPDAACIPHKNGICQQA